MSGKRLWIAVAAGLLLVGGIVASQVVGDAGNGKGQSATVPSIPSLAELGFDPQLASTPRGAEIAVAVQQALTEILQEAVAHPGVPVTEDQVRASLQEKLAAKGIALP